jgi:hypothetical protein
MPCVRVWCERLAQCGCSVGVGQAAAQTRRYRQANGVLVGVAAQCWSGLLRPGWLWRSATRPSPTPVPLCSIPLPLPQLTPSYLDHLQVGDPELTGLRVQHRGHDRVERVAVQHGTRTAQLVRLCARWCALVGVTIGSRQAASEGGSQVAAVSGGALGSPHSAAGCAVAPAASFTPTACCQFKPAAALCSHHADPAVAPLSTDRGEERRAL